MAINPGVMASSPGFFLDSFTGIEGAYSMRRISGAEISVVRVRRDNDDAEADFTAAEIDSGALVTWVGAGNDGLIAKIYDQSGSDNDAVQTTEAAQPTLVSSGTLVTSGGLPAWEHATASNLLIDGISNIAAIDAWFLHDTSDVRYLYPTDNNAIDNFGFVARDGHTSTQIYYDYGSPKLFIDGSGSETTGNRDAIHAALNGRKLAHHQAGNVSDWDDFEVGWYGNSSVNSYNYQGKFQLILIWDSDQSGNKTAIEASLNSYYEVY